MLTIGIDPGLTGGLGVLSATGHYVEVHPMPVKAKGQGGKHEVDAAALSSLLRRIAMIEQSRPSHFGQDAGSEQIVIAMVVLERQRPFPGQGVSSMYSLGDSVGVVRGVCAALGVALEYVEPRIWKKAYKLAGGDGAKERARARAIELFPMAPLGRKKDHGLAEALLIARFATCYSSKRS